MRIGGAGDEVQGAWAEGADADPGAAGQTPVGRGHERGRLLVPGQDELDSGGAQRLDDIEILFAGDAEDALNTLIFQRRNQKVRALGHANGLTPNPRSR